MPAWSDITFVEGQSVTFTVPLTPPVPIGGWDVRFQLNQNFPLSPWQSGLVVKSMASGYYGVSGMNIVNSGQGQFRITLDAVDTSGFVAGNYAYEIRRLNSGNITSLTQGYITVSEG